MEKRGQTVAGALAWATALLKEQGNPTARPDAEMLLSHLLGVGRVWLYAHPEAELTEPLRQGYAGLLEERIGQKPIQYLTGRQEFMGLEFQVTRDVLIPRPETEILVESVLERLAGHPNPWLVDMGTGSGAIGISLAYYRPDCRVYALDLSPAALAVARQNAGRLGVGDRIEFLGGDLWAPLMERGLEKHLSAVVANPPYIPSAEIRDLAAEVRDYEPHLALDGGWDGLDYYRRLAGPALTFLTPGGILALEVGAGQAAAVAGLLSEARFRDIRRIRDLAGWERVIIGTK